MGTNIQQRFELRPGVTSVGRDSGGEKTELFTLDVLVSAAASPNQALLRFRPEVPEVRVKDHPSRVNPSRLRRARGAATDSPIAVSRWVRLEHGDAIGFPLEWFRLVVSMKGHRARAELCRDLDVDTVRIAIPAPRYEYRCLSVSLETGAAEIEGVPVRLAPQARAILRALCLHAGEPVTRHHPGVEDALGYVPDRVTFQKRVADLRRSLAGARGLPSPAILETLRPIKRGDEAAYRVPRPREPRC